MRQPPAITICVSLRADESSAYISFTALRPDVIPSALICINQSNNVSLVDHRHDLRIVCGRLSDIACLEDHILILSELSLQSGQFRLCLSSCFSFCLGG